MPKLFLAALFVALVALAIAGWTVNAFRWLVSAPLHGRRATASA